MKPTMRSLAGLAGLLLLASCQDNQQDAQHAPREKGQVFHWKMVTTWPPDFPIFQEGAEKFASDLRLMSDGRLQIQVYAGGELVPPLQVFDAVSAGTVEMGHGASYYWAGKVPAAQFFSAVPFGMDAHGMQAWLTAGGGLELWREIYAPFQVRPFPMGNTGTQMGGWFNKELHGLEDLRGLRMRIPGLGGKVLAEAGGNPVLMSGAELYTALERGIIDATEWVSPFHDLRLGLNDAAEYYYYPGWHEPGTEFELIIHDNAWQQLPRDLQRMVETAATATGVWIRAQMDVHNREALAGLLQQDKVKLRRFPEEMLNELYRVTTRTLNETAARDKDFQRVYQAYDTFRQGLRAWRELGEDAYREARSTARRKHSNEDNS